MGCRYSFGKASPFFWGFTRGWGNLTGRACGGNHGENDGRHGGCSGDAVISGWSGCAEELAFETAAFWVQGKPNKLGVKKGAREPRIAAD